MKTTNELEIKMKYITEILLLVVIELLLVSLHYFYSIFVQYAVTPSPQVAACLSITLGGYSSLQIGQGMQWVGETGVAPGQLEA